MKQDLLLFLRFCAVGSVGFAVDSGVTLALHRFGLAPLTARVSAFLLAATVTWILNRDFTFRSGGGPRRWLLYVALTASGGLLNVALFWVWVGYFGTSRLNLVVGVAIGSAAALSLNFGVSKHLVFARDIGRGRYACN